MARRASSRDPTTAGGRGRVLWALLPFLFGLAMLSAVEGGASSVWHTIAREMRGRHGASSVWHTATLHGDDAVDRPHTTATLHGDDAAGATAVAAWAEERESRLRAAARLFVDGGASPPARPASAAARQLYDPSLAPVPLKSTQQSASLLVFMHIPKTAGSYFWARVRNVAKAHDIERYPDSQVSFHNVGCGTGGGAAHCDYSELGACLRSDYTGELPHVARVLGSRGATRFVTNVRDPVDRVMSEYFWGCARRVRLSRKKRWPTADDGKVLFDWPRSLFDALKPDCETNEGTLRKWIADPLNPAHNRGLRMFANHSNEGGVPHVWRRHNCMAGSERVSNDGEFTRRCCGVGVRQRHGQVPPRSVTRLCTPRILTSHSRQVWRARYGIWRGREAEIADRVNTDGDLVDEAIRVSEAFWFIGLKEQPDVSVALLCRLGNYERCEHLEPKKKRKHRGGRRALAAINMKMLKGSGPSGQTGGGGDDHHRHSSRPKGFALSATTRDSIEARNAGERALYEHIVRDFRAKVVEGAT